MISKSKQNKFDFTEFYKMVKLLKVETINDFLINYFTLKKNDIYVFYCYECIRSIT